MLQLLSPRSRCKILYLVTIKTECMSLLIYLLNIKYNYSLKLYCAFRAMTYL